jgi:hypothetical protein
MLAPSPTRNLRKPGRRALLNEPNTRIADLPNRQSRLFPGDRPAARRGREQAHYISLQTLVAQSRSENVAGPLRLASLTLRSVGSSHAIRLVGLLLAFAGLPLQGIIMIARLESTELTQIKQGEKSAAECVGQVEGGKPPNEAALRPWRVASSRCRLLRTLTHAGERARHPPDRPRFRARSLRLAAFASFRARRSDGRRFGFE